MAATTTTGFGILTPVRSSAAVCVNRRRRIDPRAGHALEILGHAIEYLTDEFVHCCTSSSSGNAQLEAVRLLMARNREVYFECPEIPSLGERWRAFLLRRVA